MNTLTKLLVLLTLVAGACKVEQRSSIVVRGRAFAEASEDGCSYDPDGKFALWSGVLDLSYAAGYELPIYVENQLTVPPPPATEDAKDWAASAARVRVNPSEYIEEFRPTGILPYGGENVIPMTTLAVEAEGGRGVVVTTVIGPALRAEMHRAIVEVASATNPKGIDAATRAAILGGETRTIVLGISLQGHTKDGEFLETNEWYYPVDVCLGCLAPPVCLPDVTLPDGTVQRVEVLTYPACVPAGQDGAPVCVPVEGA